MISIAATKKKFKMACLPLPEAQQHCATKTKEKETHLHYVELLEGGDVVEAYCTSDPIVVLDHVKHLCSHYTCGGDVCTMLYVLEIRVNKGDKEECKIKAFASVNGGFQKHGEDDCPTQSQSSKLLEECKEK